MWTLSYSYVSLCFEIICRTRLFKSKYTFNYLKTSINEAINICYEHYSDKLEIYFEEENIDNEKLMEDLILIFNEIKSYIYNNFDKQSINIFNIKNGFTENEILIQLKNNKFFYSKNSIDRLFDELKKNSENVSLINNQINDRLYIENELGEKFYLLIEDLFVFKGDQLNKIKMKSFGDECFHIYFDTLDYSVIFKIKNIIRSGKDRTIWYYKFNSFHLYEEKILSLNTVDKDIVFSKNANDYELLKSAMLYYNNELELVKKNNEKIKVEINVSYFRQVCEFLLEQRIDADSLIIPVYKKYAKKSIRNVSILCYRTETYPYEEPLQDGTLRPLHHETFDIIQNYLN